MLEPSNLHQRFKPAPVVSRAEPELELEVPPTILPPTSMYVLATCGLVWVIVSVILLAVALYEIGQVRSTLDEALASEEFLTNASFLENFVILKPNPDYEPEKDNNVKSSK